jgi:hypothetical protein
VCHPDIEASLNSDRVYLLIAMCGAHWLCILIVGSARPFHNNDPVVNDDVDVRFLLEYREIPGQQAVKEKMRALDCHVYGLQNPLLRIVRVGASMDRISGLLGAADLVSMECWPFGLCAGAGLWSVLNSGVVELDYVALPTIACHGRADFDVTMPLFSPAAIRGVSHDVIYSEQLEHALFVLPQYLCLKGNVVPFQLDSTSAMPALNHSKCRTKGAKSRQRFA